MKEINRKLLVIAVALLAVAMLSVPVMAAPATKFPASTTVIESINGPPTKVKATESGVVHVWGIPYTNKRTLTIGVDDYPVYAVGSFDITWNSKTGVAVSHFTAVWYVGSLEAPTDDGFSGRSEIKVFNVVNPQTLEGADYTTSYSVMQGFGSFAQQTLKLSYEGPFPAFDTNGYCIIP